MKDKICFLIPTTDPGGIETYLLRFMLIYSSKLDITVIVKNEDHGLLYNDYIGTGANILLFKTSYLGFKTWVKIYKIFKAEKFNTVCDFTANFAGVYMFLAKFANVKNRYAFYRQSTNHYKPTLLNNAYNFFVNQLVIKFSTKIFSNSQAGINFFFQNKNIDVSKFKVIKNGLDINIFNKAALPQIKGVVVPTNSFLIGHTGRNDILKNQKFIIKVAEIVCSEIDDIYFVFIGLGTENLKIEIKNKLLLNKIIFCGYRNDVPLLLKEFDMYFFPSLSEGQPNALIEALVCGVPILASNIPSICETVPDKLINQLIDPYDVENAVLHIKKMYFDEDLKNKLDVSAWAIDNYNSALRFNEFYQQLIL